jgi:hypothetical protein
MKRLFNILISEECLNHNNSIGDIVHNKIMKEYPFYKYSIEKRFLEKNLFDCNYNCSVEISFPKQLEWDF